jgi:hypothetical protein
MKLCAACCGAPGSAITGSMPDKKSLIFKDLYKNKESLGVARAAAC